MAVKKKYDVIIVGGGVTGASLLYLLSEYSNVRSVLLLEKYGSLASLNSNSSNNAQTLHSGDIENNYSFEHSKAVKEASERIVRYSARLPSVERRHIIKECQKMVLAVGDDEDQILERNYSSGLKDLYPGLRHIGRKGLERIEPSTVKKRDPDEKVSALLSDNGHTVDFGMLTHSFVAEAKKRKRVKIDVLLNTRVTSITGQDGEYEIATNRKSYRGRFVVFAAGTYSLYFAKSMGYEKNLSILSVGGNFYTSPGVLRGKVYRVQIGGIPFAAVHGDPDFHNGNITRFGPTVTIPPLLEKHHPETFIDYAKSFDFDIPTMVSLKRILFNKDIERIIRNNAIYGLPVVGKYYFLKNEVAKIVPAMKYGDITFGERIGGIRPQIIDEKKKALVLGAGKIREPGLIFNITPSPGASSCIQAALEDVVDITKHIGRGFDVKKFEKDLGKIESEAVLKKL